ncbi:MULTISPECIES: superoxide dismutase family protein [unclassified Pseudomonas]|uniref:superoxide dismutase family protein n=1 Tax=unclassified Pseudomonas TaxID=196821 RepID=UPI000BD52751|nr:MULTISPECIES: superoxide dismutase family protein [unclassified Pseudomonas]PVZ16507.1 Cu-Zn family superoxide dismutase [Pseudomonas sp. URIL14HWK12:I12]PVZ25637.1 Cu-Zn family superoxide dismutase [Pseudomonas sp. URIL14HWK12:I10]PVZ36839.1 Cu-Zn family superoxide dismutase [Pseudomonas sp. URIL14HWK12:I11]SNZ12510.1 superoxide dismutase, Cu-Zn family [Pseudomonas sp. URIL14HWK12:I9]
MKSWIALSLVLAASGAAQAATAADTLKVELKQATAQGEGKSIGSVTLSESPYGVVFTPALEGVAPGVHGFHVHANGSCAPTEADGKPVPAGAAGGHWDPANTGKHSFPWDDAGHRGDLPPLIFTADGKADQPVLAPKIKHLADLKGHALMVHVGGDNHADHPAPLGGGGARFACGVIE